MRFFGSGSISSVLKTALNVVFYGLCGLIICLVLCILSLLSVPTLASGVIARINQGVDLGYTLNTSTLALVLTAYGLSLSGYMLIMRLTRQVFSTLAQGDVFSPQNSVRLRNIGFGLAGIEVFGYFARLVGAQILGLHFEPVNGLRAVTTGFSVLVVFVLAEVFKEGARLRHEAQLTV